MLDFEKATQALQYHENILILPSSPVDGDSIGSALAIYSLLQHMGKNATVVLTSEIPDIYKFLPNVNAVQKTVQLYSDFIITIDLKGKNLKDVQHSIEDNKVNILVTPETGSFTKEQISFPEPKKYFDLVITVDCADVTQLGDFYKQNYNAFADIPSINIDHHVSNKNFGSLNLVDTNVASTTQIIYSWFKQMNVEFDSDIATLLLAGIITDTGSFQNANTTPESFDVAADLIDLGGRQQEIIRHVYKTKHLNSLKLWGRILSKIQVDEGLRYLWSSVTLSDFQQTGTNTTDKGDIIDDLLSNAQEADVVLLLEEKIDGSLHGSLRSTDEAIDISPIAQQFGGGGHAMASGFTIPNANVESHQAQILQAIQSFQESRLNQNQAQPESPTPASPSPIFQEQVAEVKPTPEVSEPTTLESQPALDPEPQVSESPVVQQVETSPDQVNETVEEIDQINEENLEDFSIDQEIQDVPEVEAIQEDVLEVQPTPEAVVLPEDQEEVVSQDLVLEDLDQIESPQEEQTVDLSGDGLLDPSDDTAFDPIEFEQDAQSEIQLDESIIPDVDPLAGEGEKSIDQLTRDFVSAQDNTTGDIEDLNQNSQV